LNPTLLRHQLYCKFELLEGPQGKLAMSDSLAQQPDAELTREHRDVIIVGAGLSGIGAACHLAEKCPERDYLLLESREAMGGTWDLFRYPGIRSDSDMHTLPNVEEKKQILYNTYNFVTSLGIFKPKIALISAVESVNEDIPSTVEAREIVEQLKDTDKWYIGGPFSVDVALSHESADVKGITHVVAGDADILIFPCVVSGNTFYKATTFLANTTAAGLVLGARNPIVLTSRADSYKSKLYSIALAVVSTDIL
jgi:hypothetical protein